MTTVQTLVTLLEQLAPLTLAESWDNVGLLLGHRNASVRNVMTCLTLTEAVAVEAVKRDVQLIVTHHPILFRGAKRLTDASSEGRTILQLAAAGIAVYSAHTAFDSAAEGINQSLAEQLGLSEVRPLRPDRADVTIGTGRMGRFAKPLDREEFLSRVLRVTSAMSLDVCNAGRDQVSIVGIGCGSAAEFITDAARLGCDTFVTGEARFHSVLEAQASQMNLVLTGHYSSERPAMIVLAQQIQSRCPDVVAMASECDVDPLFRYPR